MKNFSFSTNFNKKLIVKAIKIKNGNASQAPNIMDTGYLKAKVKELWFIFALKFKVPFCKFSAKKLQIG